MAFPEIYSQKMIDLDLVIDVLFLTDCIVNFFMATIDSEYNIVDDRKVIISIIPIQNIIDDRKKIHKELVLS